MPARVCLCVCAHTSVNYLKKKSHIFAALVALEKSSQSELRWEKISKVCPMLWTKGVIICCFTIYKE